jgi:hypothetical protein
LIWISRAARRLVVAALVTGCLVVGGTPIVAGALSVPLPSGEQRVASPVPLAQGMGNRDTTTGVRPGYDRRPTGFGPNSRILGQHRVADQDSYNWAGLAESGAATYTGVSANWTVPTIQASGPLKVSSSWIGIDGFTNDALIQTGTEQDTSGGTAHYYAWWEILPDPETRITTITVSPGDQMSADVFQVTPGTWTISITDLTSAQNFTRTGPYGDPSKHQFAASAEWIEEMTGTSTQAPLANFHTANFTNLNFTTSDPTGNTPTLIDMVDNTTGDVIAYPTVPDSSDLTVTYGQPPTKTSIGANQTEVTATTSVQYSATVTTNVQGMPTPSGSVTFKSGSTMLCTAALLSSGSGSCDSTTAPAGNDTITGTYSGSNVFSGSSGSTSLTVDSVPSQTTVGATPNSVAQGASVSYLATVTTSVGGVPKPSGSVTFRTGSTALCTATLSSGSGSCSSSAAPAGTDTISGAYAGDTVFSGSSGTTSLMVASPPPPPQHGYWLVGSDGGIFTFGSAQFYGSTGSLRLQRPVVGIVPTADRGGYWLDASDGGVFAFGDAGFYGSIPGLGLHPAGSGLPNSLNAPIVGMVPSADGGGYFMVASDGGVFAFGDARFAGSCPGIGGCAGAAVAVMPDASGNGYWLVTQSGHIYTFGDAPYYGSPGSEGAAVTSAVRTPDGHGYWILFASGDIANFGDAGNFGSPAGQMGGTNPASAIFTTSDGGGYWVAAADGAVANYGDAPNDGSMLGTSLNGSIIAASGW